MEGSDLLFKGLQHWAYVRDALGILGLGPKMMLLDTKILVFKLFSFLNLAVRGSPKNSNYFFRGSQLCTTTNTSAV